jgi:iron complex transport system substrate-binding protein
MNRRSLLASALLIATPAGFRLSRSSAQTPTASPVPANPQLPVTVNDASGNPVDITDVSRIVTLNGNVTETLFALGFGQNVVATDVSALYPEAAQTLPKIGYQRQLSAEAILSFDPTLVIGTVEAGPPEVIDQIRNAGISVLIIPVQQDAAGAVDEIRFIGTAMGVPDAGNTIAEQVAATIAEAQSLTASEPVKPRVAFLYLRGDGTQLIAGSHSQADAVITAAAGINAGAETGVDGYQPITPEALVAAAPDVILVMQLGLAMVGGLDGLLAIPGVAQTQAAQNNRIIAFEDLYLLGFGPRIGDAIYDLSAALYPDLHLQPKNPQWQGTDVSNIPTNIPGM